MDQLVLIKSAHKIERTPGPWLQGGVYCQEAQIDSITLHIHQITSKIARPALRRVSAEIVIPEQSQINIMISLFRARQLKTPQQYSHLSWTGFARIVRQLGLFSLVSHHSHNPT